MTGPAPRPAARLRRRAAGLLAAVVVVVLALPGCASAQPEGDELYASARHANLLFKEAVATVLVHISDGTWQVQEYGDLPVDCRPGYSFAMHRTTFEGFTLEADAPTTASRLERWLSDRGWTTAPATAADGEVRVEASDPALEVGSLVIDIGNGGESGDAIGVGATSTCFDGDADALTALLYPGYPDHVLAHEPLPAGELAGATPVFGFTDDGAAR
ncbi:hypothetical protein ACFC1I_19200 [Microbacterium sp. NPDC056044]|uniref:hypothetical protein n=1 Tax=Microbacterium sp. NPDC056044 TaxID=3345690 RepID=UPI0035DA3EA4